MIKYSKLLQSRLPEIEKSLWYRQRFDACPHFMFFLGDSHISSIQRTKYQYGQRIAYAGFSKHRADWYHNLGELEYTTSKIIKASKKDPKVSRKMISNFMPWQERFYKDCLKLNSLDLGSLSKKELLDKYNSLADIYTKKLNSSGLIDGFTLSTDTLIASKIKTFLESKGLENRFVEYFGILTSPIFTSFLQLEDIELLKVAKKVKANPKLKNPLIKKHQKNYFWTQNNYVKDNILTEEFFEKRINQYLKLDVKGIDKKINEIKSIASDHKKQKLHLIKTLMLPKEEITLLAITDDFNWWQDERKKGTFWATHYFSKLLEEISKRTKYSLEQLKYAFPPEMEAVLNEKIDTKELDRRINYCIILWVKGKYDVTTDLPLIEKLDRIGTGEYKKGNQELKGFVASKGIVRGKVKIIESVEEIYKVQTGDVLVAVMTRPDYLPAMQKAAAFVTDEGGVTCHASIIAREMKKPCIIGTKIATKILKDGDMVEVDADKGIVRIIKNKSS